MIPRTLAVCLLMVFVIPLHAQQAQPQIQKQAQPAPPVSFNPCPRWSHCVDLCALAAQLDSKNTPKTAYTTSMGRNLHLAAHDDILLSYPDEQVIWRCSKGKGFQITQIHKVIQKKSDKTGPDMPFDPEKYAQLRAPQGPWAQLASGPPVAGAVGHTYKFSFIIAGQPTKESPIILAGTTPPIPYTQSQDDPTTLISGTLYDPHIIVTGPGVTVGKGSPTPTPSPTPHKDEKSGSKKSGAGGSVKR